MQEWKKGVRFQQRYLNGDTHLGRLSATVIERFRGDELLLRYFRLSNTCLFAGEDTPEELPRDFSFIIATTGLGEVIQEERLDSDKLI